MAPRADMPCRSKSPIISELLFFYDEKVFSVPLKQPMFGRSLDKRADPTRNGLMQLFLEPVRLLNHARVPCAQLNGHPPVGLRLLRSDHHQHDPAYKRQAAQEG